MNIFGKSPSHQQEAKQDEDQRDLTTLLSADQRAELLRLITNATESMLKSLEDTFDASQIEADIKAEGEASDKENPNVASASLSPEQKEELRKAEKQRELELSEPKMKELKSAAVEFITHWRDAVILRVGEVVNSREPPSEKDRGHPKPTEEDPLKQSLEASEMDRGVNTSVRGLYPPIKTSLAALPKDQRMLILHSMLLLSLEHYTAHSRVLLLYLASSLNVEISVLAEDETKVAQGLLEAAKHMSGDAETQKRSDENKTARAWKVGLASVAGAALIGVTGGLAAPLLAAGVGGVMGGLGLGATAAAGYLGTLAGSGVIVGSLFGAYGGRMTGKMMDAYAREVEDFAFLPVRVDKTHGKAAGEGSSANRRLRVAIGISGWLTDKDQVITPWRVLGHGAEVFALRYELEALLHIGNALTEMAKGYAWGYAKKEIISRTIFATLSAALWPLGLLKVSRIVDNPFSVAKSRSDKAGRVLADALINKAQGERPVTLIGYSLGARVIYTCLMCLAERRAFGLIESVVLIGAPTPSVASDWRMMRSVVAGRLVNVYSENDYILGFVYRTSSIQFGVAGLQPVEGVKGVQNEDVSSVVNGHLRYRYLVGSILKRIGFEDIDTEELEKEQGVLRMVERLEEKEEVRAGEQEQKPADKQAQDADEETQKLQKDLDKMNLQAQPQQKQRSGT